LGHIEQLFEVTAMFWAILSVFFLCNCLLVWGVFRQRRDPFDLPPVMTMNWFRVATMVGGVGWVMVPAMCISAFGLLGAAAGTLAYFFSGALIAFLILGATDGSFSAVRG
jgi:hypothetical protein